MTTLVAIAAATLPLWVHWLGYVFFFAGVIKYGLEHGFSESPRQTLMGLLTLGIFATVVGVLGWAFVAALREKGE